MRYLTQIYPDIFDKSLAQNDAGIVVPIDVSVIPENFLERIFIGNNNDFNASSVNLSYLTDIAFEDALQQNALRNWRKDTECILPETFADTECKFCSKSQQYFRASTLIIDTIYTKTTESLLWSFFFVNLTGCDNIAPVGNKSCRFISVNENTR